MTTFKLKFILEMPHDKISDMRRIKSFKNDYNASLATLDRITHNISSTMFLRRKRLMFLGPNFIYMGKKEISYQLTWL